MTHKDIFTKFMIEYDKANVTSSYPSLTEYEIATVLDKAYMALISLKVTGNNIRKAPFEADIKSVADLLPLVTTVNISSTQNDVNRNVKTSTLPDDMLYFVSAALKMQLADYVGPYGNITGLQYGNINPVNKIWEGNINYLYSYANLVSHQIAQRFMMSLTNVPWVKNPVCYIEDNKLYTVVDPSEKYLDTLDLTYIKKPNTFVKNLDKIKYDLFEDVQEHFFEDTYIRYWYTFIMLSENLGKIHEDVENCPDTYYYLKSGDHFITIPYISKTGDDMMYYDITSQKNYTIGGSYNEILYMILEAYRNGDIDTDQKTIAEQILEFGRYKNIDYYIIEASDAPIFKLHDILADDEGTLAIVDGQNVKKLDDFIYSNMNISYSDVTFTRDDKTVFDKMYDNVDLLIDYINLYTFSCYQFELDNIAAEELISLAVTYALENVESLRLNTHLGVRGLEG